MLKFRFNKIKKNESTKKSNNVVNKFENKKRKKEQQKNKFNDLIKIEPIKISEMDKTIYEFEKALKERKEYEKELEEKGAREFKAYKKKDCDREL